ncbi:MAG TPA: glycosyltransferase, partial [Sedimentisphaerales bacterium]
PDEVRSSVRSELNIPEEMPVIVFAGRICEQKRPVLLADILRAAREQGLIFQALIIGDGEQRGQLEGLLSQYHLTANVQMLGSVSHQRWLDILVASDIFLMPSQYEGISIALLESMTVGVVPVVAKVGGHDEIVTQDAGVLIPHGDNELREYVDAIRRLLSNSAELQQMSERCKVLAASKLSWEGMIDNFLALLDESHQFRIDQPRYPISPSFGRELALGNVWLTSQRDTWEKTATEREQSIAALQAQVQDLQTGNAWLTSQREAWEKTAAEREQSIVALQAQVQDLQTGNAWLTSQRDAWEKNAAALTSRLRDHERIEASNAILNKHHNWRMRFVNFLSKTKFF